MSDKSDIIIGRFFLELDKKYPRISLIKGINNKETYYRGDDLLAALETALKEKGV